MPHAVLPAGACLEPSLHMGPCDTVVACVFMSCKAGRGSGEVVMTLAKVHGAAVVGGVGLSWFEPLVWNSTPGTQASAEGLAHARKGKKWAGAWTHAPAAAHASPKRYCGQGQAPALQLSVSWSRCTWVPSVGQPRGSHKAWLGLRATPTGSAPPEVTLAASTVRVSCCWGTQTHVVSTCTRA